MVSKMILVEENQSKEDSVIKGVSLLLMKLFFDQKESA